MKRTFITILFSIFSVIFAFSQTYEQLSTHLSAFNEMLSMIKGEKPINFKRAVFLVENAYYNNQLDYNKFCADIDKHVQKIKNMIKSQSADAQKFKTIGNYAIFAYMVIELPENDNKPFLYDFDNFMSSENLTNGFVTKLLQTKKGNCTSLPYLYKIFANEIGAEAHLAFAPLHCYIKHKDENGKWRNIELTNGSVARDVWMIQTMGITPEQIASGIYMRAISEKECVANCLADLLYLYNRQYFHDEYTLPIIETALTYLPNNLRLLLHKSTAYDIFAYVEQYRPHPDNARIEFYTAVMDAIDKKLSEMGYIQGDFKEYEEWVKSEGRKLNEEYQEELRRKQEKLNKVKQ